MHAVARIAYRELVPNVQVSWVKMGAVGSRQALMAGANDLGGTLMDENISRAAGASHGQRMAEDDFRRIVEPLGRPLRPADHPLRPGGAGRRRLSRFPAGGHPPGYAATRVGKRFNNLGAGGPTVADETQGVLMPTEVSSRVGFFDRFAGWASHVASRATFFAFCVALILLWAPSILVIRNVDTWQLIINTATTCITFLMVALLQNSQTRSDQAVQHKLNAIADGLADVMATLADRNEAPALRDDMEELRAAVGLEEKESTTDNQSRSEGNGSEEALQISLTSGTGHPSEPERRTGFTSRTGVPSMASSGPTWTRRPSTARISTRCSPIGFGRSAERVLNTPVSRIRRVVTGTHAPARRAGPGRARSARSTSSPTRRSRRPSRDVGVELDPGVGRPLVALLGGGGPIDERRLDPADRSQLEAAHARSRSDDDHVAVGNM